jgi:hypothetical protein
VEWLHPVGEVVTAILAADLRLRWLHEHDQILWRMFAELEEVDRQMYRWPDEARLPLGYSPIADKVTRMSRDDL